MIVFLAMACVGGAGGDDAKHDTAPAAEPCEPTDAHPTLQHDPSQYRGYPVDPVGGSVFDPRLADCTWEAAYGEASEVLTYDALGRLETETFGPPDSVVYSSYSWSDDGCLVAFDFDGQLVESACDHHGYPICSTSVAGGHGERHVNAYDQDLLSSATSDAGFTTSYTWEGGRIVRLVDEFAGTEFAYEWDGDRLLAARERDGRETTWTWDADRPLTLTWSDGGSLDFVYDGGDWPVGSVDQDGLEYARYTVACE